VKSLANDAEQALIARIADKAPTKRGVEKILDRAAR
jgi:hypothetical protein